MNIDQRTIDGAFQRRTADRQLAGIAAPIRRTIIGIMDDLAPLIAEMFANVDDFFFSRAERADDSNQYHVFFEAMRKIRSNREEICLKFFSGITQAAAGLWGADGVAGTGPAENLRPHRFNAGTMSVLTEEEMEVSVAVSGIAQKGKSRYGRDFGTLIETLNGIARPVRGDRPDNPLGITSMTQSFVAAVQGLSLELPVMLSFLKLFERHVADRLGSVYAAALERLERDGIKIFEGSTNRTTGVHTPQHGDASRPGEVVTPGNATRSHEVLRPGDVSRRSVTGVASFPELQSLLATRHGCQSAGAIAPEGLPVDELIDSVSSVQHRYMEQLGRLGRLGLDYPSLQSFLLDLPQDHGGFRDAGRDQQDTLKLVSALFEHMFRNDNLSVASKALIARMQFPVLKMALVDQSLFSDSDHPTRQLLNRIATDGIGWPASEALLRRNPLYLAAEEIVARLNDQPKPDVETFARLLQEWTELASRHQRRTKTAVRRLNETALGKAKLDAAKRIVQTTVNERAAGARLPGPIATFVSADLTHAMVVACVKYGTDGEEWRELCFQLESLLSVFDPSRLKNTDSRPSVSDLISQMRATLERHGSTTAAAVEGLKPIAAMLERMAAAERASELSTVGYDVQDLEIMEEIHLTDVDELVGAEENQEDYRLASLEPGTWVEINADDLERPLRCQLAVAVNETQLYVFNDDKGMKVREMSRKSLLAALSSGKIGIIRQELLVERAIEDMMASLKSYSPIDQNPQGRIVDKPVAGPRVSPTGSRKSE